MPSSGVESTPCLSRVEHQHAANAVATVELASFVAVTARVSSCKIGLGCVLGLPASQRVGVLWFHEMHCFVSSGSCHHAGVHSLSLAHLRQVDIFEVMRRGDGLSVLSFEVAVSTHSNIWIHLPKWLTLSHAQRLAGRPLSA